MQVTNILKGDPTIVNRYLADQLGENERSAFEAQLVSDPDLLREVEATARLKAGLQKLRDTGQLDALVAERSRTPLFFAAAAAVAVLVLGITLMRWNTDGGAPMLAASLSSLVDPSGHPLPIGNTYAVYRTRASAYDAEITLPASQQAIELRVQPSSVDLKNSYRASLSLVRENGGSEPTASIADLAPASDKFITLFVDSAQLIPGEYRLVVSREEDGRSAEGESFSIRVKSPRPN
jgi:hypothetical protein